MIEEGRNGSATNGTTMHIPAFLFSARVFYGKVLTRPSPQYNHHLALPGIGVPYTFCEKRLLCHMLGGKFVNRLEV